MAIDLTNAVSDKMKDRVNAKDNKPTTEPGFDSGVDFSSLFDDIDSIDSGGSSGGGDSGFGGFGDSGFGGGDSGFGGGSSSGFGDSGFGGGGNSGFGGGTGFGDSGFGGSGFGGSGFGGGGFGGNGFGGLNIGGQMGQTMPAGQTQPAKKDAIDSAVEFTSDALKASGNILKSLVKSLKTRNFDDFVSVAIDWMILGGGAVGLGLLLKVIAWASKFNVLSSYGYHFIISGLITGVFGLIGFGVMSIGVINDAGTDKHISDMADIPIEMGDSVVKEEGLDSLYASLLDDFSMDLDGFEDSDSSSDDFSGGFSGGFDDDFSGGFDTPSEPEPPAYESNEDRIRNIAGNAPRIDRKFLVENLGEFFPQNAKGFADKVTLDSDSEEYSTIRVLVLQAIADAAKMNIEELSCDIISVESTMFCYIIVCERQKGLSKTDELKKEIESQFRSDAEDVSVSASIKVEHGNYKIIITKGNNNIITIGDCLQVPEVRDYMLNTKNMLPFIAGIDEYGNPILADEKNYTTMMIVGKMRSGKSWYITSVLTSLFAFNSPDDLEVILVDPKESNLFYDLSCFPHVIGLHKGDKLVQMMQEIIDVEGTRRKAILKEHRCDSIWSVRRKGIKMPVMLIVIDEYMSALSMLDNQGGLDKEFAELFNVAITQLPFVGIYFIFVPHRAQGVVNKVTRSMILYTAAIRAEDEIIKETLDVKKWDIPLINPGDTALKMSDVGITKFVRAAAATLSDEDNSELIHDLCRAWYKMGVDIPDRNGLQLCYNRDEVEIAKALGINTSDVTHVQYTDDDMYGGHSKSFVESVSEVDMSEIRPNKSVKNESSTAKARNKAIANIFGEDEENNAETKRRYEEEQRARREREEQEDAEILSMMNDMMEEENSSSNNADDDDDWMDGINASNLWDDEE